jgi:hypothetical protein
MSADGWNSDDANARLVVSCQRPAACGGSSTYSTFVSLTASICSKLADRGKVAVGGIFTTTPIAHLDTRISSCGEISTGWGPPYKGILSLMQPLSSACARATLVRPESAVSADRESMHAGDKYEGFLSILAAMQRRDR